MNLPHPTHHQCHTCLVGAEAGGELGGLVTGRDRLNSAMLRFRMQCQGCSEARRQIPKGA